VVPSVTRRQMMTGAAGLVAAAAVAAAGAEAGLTLKSPGSSRAVVAGTRRVMQGDSRAWTTPVDSPISSLIVAGAVVCVCCEQTVVALDAVDGRKRWAVPYESAATPVGAGALLFLMTSQTNDPQITDAKILRTSDGALVRSLQDVDTVQAEDGLVYVWNSGLNSPGQGIYVMRTDGKAAITQVWSSLDDKVQQLTGGIVFTDSGYALRGSDGTQMCAFPAGETVQVVSDGIAYLGNGYSPEGLGAPISALDLRDGTQLWTFSAASTVLAVEDGIAYVSDSEADNPTVYALRASDGARLWTFPSVSLGSPSLAADQDVVYIGTGSSLTGIAAGGGGRVCALRVGDGTELWRVATLGDTPASLITEPGLVYVCDGSLGGMGAGEGGRVIAFRSSDGSQAWGFQAGGTNPQLMLRDAIAYVTVGSPFAAVSGTVLDTGAVGKACALQRRSGAQIWELIVPWYGQNPAVPLAVYRETAYVGGTDGVVHALRS
jgi:outer membrane protein assembly factor BamB